MKERLRNLLFPQSRVEKFGLLLLFWVLAPMYLPLFGFSPESRLFTLFPFLLSLGPLIFPVAHFPIKITSDMGLAAIPAFFINLGAFLFVLNLGVMFLHRRSTGKHSFRIFLWSVISIPLIYLSYSVVGLVWDKTHEDPMLKERQALAKKIELLITNCKDNSADESLLIRCDFKLSNLPQETYSEDAYFHIVISMDAKKAFSFKKNRIVGSGALLVDPQDIYNNSVSGKFEVYANITSSERTGQVYISELTISDYKSHFIYTATDLRITLLY